MFLRFLYYRPASLYIFHRMITSISDCLSVQKSLQNKNTIVAKYLLP